MTRGLAASGLMREMVPTAAEGASAPFERALAALAHDQYGVVSRAQLRDLGLGDSGVTARVRRGGLVPVHRGVFAVGHSMLAVRGVWMAAVLAGGPHAVLSHAAAGALWELRGSSATTIDITIPGAGGRRRREGPAHPPRPEPRPPGHDPRADPGHHPGTDDPRPRGDPEPSRRSSASSTRPRCSASPTSRRSSPQRAPPRATRERRQLLDALDGHAPGTTLTRSDLEERFLALCRAAGLPRPLCNHPVVGPKVDFVFPDHRLLVETDSWRWHRSRAQFETDRRRDAVHAAAGWRTLRFTHDRIAHHPREVAEIMGAVLAADAVA